MSVHTLSDIQTSIDSHTSKLQEAEINTSNLVGLSKVLPELNTVYGSNCVINGFSINNIFVNVDSCDVDINPGKLIIDNVIIDVTSNTIINIDLTTNYIDDGLIFLFASFANYENNNEQPFHLSVYLKQPDSSLYPAGFNPNVDGILLSAFSINLSGGTHDIKDVGDLFTRPIYNFSYNSNLISYRILPTSEFIINSRGNIYDFLNGNCVGGMSSSAPPLENLLSISMPVITASQFILHTNNAVAVDGNNLNEPITYFLLNEPSGMVIDVITGVLSWPVPIAGFYTFTLGIQNYTFVSTIEYTLEVLPNQPPSVINVPQIAGVGGELLVIAVSADDPDNDPLTYYLTNPPGDMSIDLNTGVITWNYPENGIYQFGIYVNDGFVDSPTYNYELIVENSFPVVNSIDVVINASTFFADVINSGGVGGPGSGAGGTGGGSGGGGGGGGGGTGTGGGGTGTGEGVVIVLTYSLDAGHPNGMVISPTTGIIVWIAPPPSTYTYTVIATDQFGNVYTFTVVVAIGITYAIAGVNLGITVSATDLENATLEYGLQNEPAGMFIDQTNGDIIWPNPIVGSYYFQITVTDPYLNVTVADFDLIIIELEAPQNVLVDLSNASTTLNQSPSIDLITSDVINIGDSVNKQISANDPDGDLLTWITINGISGLTLNQNGIITGTPTALGVGQTFEFTIDDGFGHTVAGTSTIDVINLNPVINLTTQLTDLTNQAPTVQSLSGIVANIGDSVSEQITANDPDGDILTWITTNEIPGLTLNQDGTVTGTPSVLGIGQVLDFTINDGFGHTVAGTFTIDIINLNPVTNLTTQLTDLTNQAPISVDNTLQTTITIAGDPNFTYQMLAVNDPDGDILIWSIETNSNGVNVDNYGLVYGTITSIGINVYDIYVDDGFGHVITLQLQITALGLLAPALDYETTNPVFDSINQPPVLVDTNLYFEINTVINHQIQVTDPELNPLLFNITSGSFPTGLTMNSTGLITGTADTNISIDTIGLTIDDGFGNSIAPNLIIEIVNLNAPSSVDGVFAP